MGAVTDLVYPPKKQFAFQGSYILPVPVGELELVAKFGKCSISL